MGGAERSSHNGIIMLLVQHGRWQINDHHELDRDAAHLVAKRHCEEVAAIGSREQTEGEKEGEVTAGIQFSTCCSEITAAAPPPSGIPREQAHEGDDGLQRSIRAGAGRRQADRCERHECTCSAAMCGPTESAAGSCACLALCEVKHVGVDGCWAEAEEGRVSGKE